ncbi:PH domain-containing protein [Rhodopseudomonas palustris]|uniref:PH domain-containing protein n=1 Tax=Thiospirillum jenense TaxID=1653858 RepID=A0A839HC28_9GAMM|nr:PH domain-containing protein [Rhodopseudomonas palustris]MBB1124838.1 PH domain-containing protein [Thiospirillum jenense]
MSEYDGEPIHGLPEQLPAGELLRWQGAPQWGALAKRAFHVRSVALYFGLLLVVTVAILLAQHQSFAQIVQATTWFVVLAVAAIGILTALAVLYARSTVYSITDRRVVIRFGIALPMAVNIPFKSIETAGLRVYADGTGDIPLSLLPSQRVSYFIMWPNVRPWHMLHAQPMLRALPDAQQAANILAATLKAASAADHTAGAPVTTDGEMPASATDASPVFSATSS